MTTIELPTSTEQDVYDRLVAAYHYGRQDAKPRGVPLVSEAEFREAIGDQGIGQFGPVYDRLVAAKLAAAGLIGGAQ